MTDSSYGESLKSTVNHEVKAAEDGQDYLEKAVIYKPDPIISDTLMHHVDGFRFLRNIKNSVILKSILLSFSMFGFVHQSKLKKL